MNKVNPYIILSMRILTGMVFIIASYDKLLDPQQFSRDISNYHFIPFGLENTVAIVLPWIELFIGLGLILGIMIDGSVLISGVLLIMFNFLVIQAMLRGFNIECGCCLLYTSDAADDSLRVDLGGRRIIKKSTITLLAF